MTKRSEDRSVIPGQPLSSATLLDMLLLVVTAGEMHSSGRCKCCAACFFLSAFLPQPRKQNQRCIRADHRLPESIRPQTFIPQCMSRSACPTLTGSQ